MKYRLAAMDLDGTTLNRKRHISEGNRKAMEEALEMGAHVVVATGRAYSALPSDVFEIKGLRYVMCSNGAQVWDIREKQLIYHNYIAACAVDDVIDMLSGMEYMYEVFIDGKAYTDSVSYEKAKRGELTFRNQDYIVETRIPVDDLMGLMREHREEIENVNINFGDMSIKKSLGEKLATIDNTTLTTSFDHNWEIGGATTGKGDALLHLISHLGIKGEECIAIGDSPNDISMLKVAGMPCCVGNAKDEVKENSKYIADTNDNDGVAEILKKCIIDA